jgi:hypothetical protein
MLHEECSTTLARCTPFCAANLCSFVAVWLEHAPALLAVLVFDGFHITFAAAVSLSALEVQVVENLRKAQAGVA